MTQDAAQVKRKGGRPRLERPKTFTITANMSQDMRELVFDTASSFNISPSTLTREALMFYIEHLNSHRRLAH